jgi:hypothetical protein
MGPAASGCPRSEDVALTTNLAMMSIQKINFECFFYWTEIWCSWTPAILEKIKIIFTCFKKIRKKNHGAANELSHKHAKFQFQTQKILSYTKITKRVDLGMHISNLQISTDFIFFM